MRLNKEFKNKCAAISEVITKGGADTITVTTNKGYNIEIANPHAGFITFTNLDLYDIGSVNKIKDLLPTFIKLGFME